MSIEFTWRRNSTQKVLHNFEKGMLKSSLCLSARNEYNFAHVTSLFLSNNDKILW